MTKLFVNSNKIGIIYLVGIFIIWISTVFFRFTGILLGNDDNYPLFALERFNRWQHVYSDVEIVGGGAVPFKIATLFPSISIQSLCQEMGFYYNQCQSGEYSIMIGFLFFGTYWLGKLLFQSHHAGFISVIGMYHPQLNLALNTSREGFYAWVITPILIGLLIKIIDNIKENERQALKRIILFALVSLFIAPSCPNPPLILSAVLLAICLLGIKIYETPKRRLAVHRILLAICLSAVAHSFWLLPVLSLFLKIETMVGALYDNVSWSRGAADLNSFPMVLFRLRVDTANFAYDSWRNEIIGKGILGFMIPILIGLLAIIGKKIKLIYLFFCFLIFSFLAKGPGGPFGFIFLHLFDLIPFFDWFRSAYDKFSLPQTFIFAFLFSGGLMYAFNLIAKQAIWVQVALLGSTLMVSMIFFHFSLLHLLFGLIVAFAYGYEQWNESKLSADVRAIRGPLSIKPILILNICMLSAFSNPFVFNIKMYSATKWVPTEYLEAKNAVSDSPNFRSYRLFHFPHDGVTHQAPNFNTGGSFNLFDNMLGIGKFPNCEIDLVLTDLFHRNEANKFQELKEILKKKSAKYIILEKELVSERFHKYIDDFKKLMESDGGFELLIDNSRVTIFDFKGALPLVIFNNGNRSIPIHSEGYFNYEFIPPEDGIIFMNRPFDKLWELTDTTGLIGHDKNHPKEFNVWQVTANNEYKLSYKIDAFARFGVGITLFFVGITVIWLSLGFVQKVLNPSNRINSQSNRNLGN